MYYLYTLLKNETNYMSTENILNGKIVFIDPKKNVAKEGKDAFFIRNACLDCSVSFNGRNYPNDIAIQLNGDKCELLDGINIGDEVNAKYSIVGKLMPPKDGVQGTEKNPKGHTAFNNILVWEIEVVKRAGATASPSPAAASVIAGAAGAPTEEKDDLPF